MNKTKDAPEGEIKESDIRGEVRLDIDTDAFKFPIKCCGKATELADKKISYKNLEFSYHVWRCPKCKKEYLDTEQAKKLEKFWTIERLLEDRTIHIERAMNFDGKTFFFRFPKELTKGWQKGDLVDIKLVTPENKLFLIEIKRTSSRA